MYCSNCGTKCADGAQFCTKCGQRLFNDKDGQNGYRPDHISELTKSTSNATSGNNHESSTEEKASSKIKSLVAGFFFALHGVLFLYYFIVDYHVFGDISHFIWKTGMCCLLFACAVLLLLRKIKPFSITLLVYCIWNIIWYAKLEYRFAFILYPLHGGMALSFFDIALIDIKSIIEGVIALSYGMLAFLAIAALMKENRFSIMVKKFWYIPGILFCLSTVTALLLTGIVYRSWLLGAVDIVCSFIEIMLSGWCLTHLYKKQSIQTYHTGPTVESMPLYDKKSEATEFNSVDHSSDYSGDTPSFGYAVLGFLIPIAGLILYLVWKEQTPLRAKSAGKGALIGVITGVGLSILMTILSFVLSMSMFGGYY